MAMITEEFFRNQMGDPEALETQIAHLSDAAEILSSRRHRLVKRYRNKWVVVSMGKVRAHAETFEELMNQIERKGVPKETAIIRFISKEPKTMILTFAAT